MVGESNGFSTIRLQQYFSFIENHVLYRQEAELRG